MSRSTQIGDPAVADKFASYPGPVRRRLLRLRELILDVAAEHADIGSIQESLKWGEPSYTAKHGSPVRIDWKSREPDFYAMYFNCNTKLVDTFKEIYGDRLAFRGNRAIHFHRDDDLPVDPLKHCIYLALRYHKLKHLELLGA